MGIHFYKSLVFSAVLAFMSPVSNNYKSKNSFNVSKGFFIQNFGNIYLDYSEQLTKSQKASLSKAINWKSFFIWTVKVKVRVKVNITIEV